MPANLLLACWPSGGGNGLGQLLREPLRGFGASTWGIIVVNGIGGLLVTLEGGGGITLPQAHSTHS